MAVFEWRDEYSVNIREIDMQHQKLVGMLNVLHEALKTGEGREAMRQVLTDLANYAKTHFAAEERLMKTHGYPEFAAHREKHEKMTARVLQYIAKFESQELKNLVEVFQFLKDWLKKHIMQTDKRYSAFLNNEGVY